MKYVIYLPASEAKQLDCPEQTGLDQSQDTHKKHMVPSPPAALADIAQTASPSTLKCKGKRYEEAVQYNKNLPGTMFMEAIRRYTGVLYKHCAYTDLSLQAQQWIDQNVCIFSGLYGYLAPQDRIANYKLPFASSPVQRYRREHATASLQKWLATRNMSSDHVLHVDLLPKAHSACIDRESIPGQHLTTTCVREEDGHIQVLTHGNKKVKGIWLRSCAQAQYLPEDMIKHSTEKVAHPYAIQAYNK